MGSGFSKMKKQARMMQEQMEKAREQSGNLEITGSSGGGLVKVVIDGENQVKKISISPDCVDKEEVEALEDLLLAAFKDAAAKLKAQSEGSQPFFGL